VTFAIPHDKLGEEVGAAVVLVDGAAVTEQELREYAGNVLAAFKVPRRIAFVSEIPKGATGKVQRIGLADKIAF
jgi:acyl-CoA synthetase (AMP-forming)/AMP-acid ligase II